MKDEAEGWTTETGEDGGYAVAPKKEDFESKREKAKKTVYGPPKPPEPKLYTMGGVPVRRLIGDQSRQWIREAFRT